MLWIGLGIESSAGCGKEIYSYPYPIKTLSHLNHSKTKRLSIAKQDKRTVASAHLN